VETFEYRQVPKDIEGNLEWRDWIAERCGRDRRAQGDQREACKYDLLFWLNTFGWTFNNKKGSWDDWRVLPFLTYPFQDELFGWMEERLGKEDMCLVKSRQMGATWCVCALFTHRFQFWPRMAFGMVSKEERLVDGTPRALFTKIEFLLKQQPGFLWHWRGKPIFEHFHMRFLNLQNDSTIEGSTTTGSTFCGDNYTAMAHDEMADRELEPGRRELAASQFATNSRIFFSTPQGAVGAFAEVAHNPAIARRDFHWPLHPEYSQGLQKLPNGYLTGPWYEKERKRLVVPALIAQELDLDFAGSSSPFFPADLIERLLREEARPPVMRGRLEHRSGSEPLFIEDRNGPLLLWMCLDAMGRPPVDDRFVVADDIGAGVGATPSVASVADRKTREKVAELVATGLYPDQFAELSVALARWFNDAFLIWESNGMTGQVFGNRVVALGYQNIYYRRDERGLEHKLAKGIVPGWHATP
jgi:hypothetical protein